MQGADGTDAGDATGQLGAASIHEAGLDDGVADCALIGLGQDVVVAEDVEVAGLVLDQGSERAAGAVGDLAAVGIDVHVVVIAAGGPHLDGRRLGRLVIER